MSNEVEYWKNRALIAEGAADKMGSVIGQFMPYVDSQGTLAYDVYNRWLQWKDKRLEADKILDR